MRIFYSLILCIITPLFFVRLLIRGKKAPGYLQRWNERLAIYKFDKLTEPVIWLHAVSVGEVEAAFPLIKKIQKYFPGHTLLVTTTTPTGSSRVQSLFGKSIRHVYLPYDLPICVKRFYKVFRPTISIIMETEIWPNLFYYSARNAIPLMMVNARLSQKSAARYSYLRSFVTSTLADVSWIAAQTDDDLKRFIEIGANSKCLTSTGNIKFDLVLHRDIHNNAAILRERIFNQRSVFIAASTHAGEDERVLNAFSIIKNRLPELLLILVPRHPERFDTVANLCSKRGFKIIRRSDDRACCPETEVFIGDTLGELKLFYATADIAFVGGSLVPKGGQNVLEPAAFGVPVIIGPHTLNFKDIAHMLVESQAAIRVYSADDLANCVVDLMKDRKRRLEMGESGKRFVQKNRGAIDRTMGCILKVMEG